VVQKEGLLRVMKADAPKLTARHQSRADVAIGAELALVVALGTRALPTVRGDRVRGEESGGVVPRWGIGRARTVALEASRPSMTRSTGLGPGGRRCCVALGEVQAMRIRPSSLDLRPLSAAGCRSRDGVGAGWGAGVACNAAFLSVTGGASDGPFADLLSMLVQEGWVSMTRWRLEFRPDR
jgi:hypothetical protein